VLVRDELNIRARALILTMWRLMSKLLVSVIHPAQNLVTGRMTAPNELADFTAIATILDVQQPNPDGTSIDPQLLDVSAFVNFFPGTQNGVFAQGFGLQVANLDPTGAGAAGSGVNAFVPLAPITGRLMNGQLTSIAIGDPVGVGLLANSPFLNLAELFYHVQFTNVTFGGTTQALDNFAIKAPGLQVQTVTLTPVSTAGTFGLVVVAGGSSDTATGIAFNAAASAVETALEALANVGSGNVTVAGAAGGPYAITFAESVVVQQLLGTTSALTGGNVVVGIVVDLFAATTTQFPYFGPS
jgi:hypothetical protein